MSIFDDPFKDFLIEERIAMTISDPRAYAKITGITDSDWLRPRQTTFFDFSYSDRPNTAALMPVDKDERILFWQAAGWVWVFDNPKEGDSYSSLYSSYRRSRTPGAPKDTPEHLAQRIVRLQNIMGCANVASGPRMGEAGDYGVWIRVSQQKRRHRDEKAHSGESMCKCKSAPYETGEAYAEARAQREAEAQAEREARNRPYFMADGNNDDAYGMRPDYSNHRVYYATEQELLDFANKLREAGGADVLDALMPSQPKESSACLIANALNFGCVVDGDGYQDGFEYGSDEFRWYMHFPGNMREEDAQRVADAVGCELRGSRHDMRIELPRHIGNAARAFDKGKGWTVKYNGGAF